MTGMYNCSGKSKQNEKIREHLPFGGYTLLYSVFSDSHGCPVVRLVGQSAFGIVECRRSSFFRSYRLHKNESHAAFFSLPSRQKGSKESKQRVNGGWEESDWMLFYLRFACVPPHVHVHISKKLSVDSNKDLLQYGLIGMLRTRKISSVTSIRSKRLVVIIFETALLFFQVSKKAMKALQIK